MDLLNPFCFIPQSLPACPTQAADGKAVNVEEPDFAADGMTDVRWRREVLAFHGTEAKPAQELGFIPLGHARSDSGSQGLFLQGSRLE